METASESKGVFRQHTRKMPAEGTAARQAYDILYANRARPVRHLSAMVGRSGPGRFPRVISDLTDYYGCDIRAKKGTGGYYMLVGEWFGSEYRDYVNEAIDEAIAEKRIA